MARFARAVAPGYPHHVTQRGNRRQQVFFSDADYQEYISLMREWASRIGVVIWAYCLMPNHVHLIAVPETEDGLARAFGEAHRRYTRYINFREGWRGYLWQGRFASFIMDERHCLCAARYIEMNPVKAGLCKHAIDYPYSSVRAHLDGKDDGLVKAGPLLELGGDWKSFLAGVDMEGEENLETHMRTGRPLGSAAFVRRLEEVLGRILLPRKSGRPRKS